jgi:hypothetical protein
MRTQNCLREQCRKPHHSQQAYLHSEPYTRYGFECKLLDFVVQLIVMNFSVERLHYDFRQNLLAQAAQKAVTEDKSIQTVTFHSNKMPIYRTIPSARGRLSEGESASACAFLIAVLRTPPSLGRQE